MRRRVQIDVGLTSRRDINLIFGWDALNYDFNFLLQFKVHFENSFMVKYS